MENTVPTLLYKADFEEALANYKVSERGKNVLATTPFVALSGIAGGGRNTVIRILVQKYNFVFMVSDTTRPPKLRDGRMEENGVDYYFRSEEEVLQDIRVGEYIEAELIHNQQVSGVSIREVERVAATGKIPVSDFEYKGIKNVLLAKPDAVIIGLVPPTYDEWLRRLSNREAIHPKEFRNRLETAEKVLENMLSESYFKIVVNEDSNSCADEVQNIAELGIYSSEVKERARSVVNELLRRVKEELAKQPR